MLNDDIFMKYLTEAPGDDDAPPEIPEDDGGADEAPPGMDDAGADGADMGADDTPPDMMGGEDESGFGDEGGEGEENPEEQMDFDEKISAILNQKLYSKFIAMLNTITSEINSLKDNSDILRSISPNINDRAEQLRKLEENINLYLKNYFMKENYSKNLLFFNKCLNLLKLLNDSFDKDVKKGIKTVDNNN